MKKVVGSYFILFLFAVRAWAQEPTAQPTNLTFTNIVNTIPGSGTGNYNDAFPAPDGYLVLMCPNVPPDIDPVDGVNYVQNEPLGQTNGNNVYPIFIGGGSSFGFTNITEETVLYFKIYSYNGGGPGIDYLQANPLEGSVDIGTPPELQSHTPPSTLGQNMAVEITASFVDFESGIADVIIFYNAAQDVNAYNDFEFATMNYDAGEDEYTFMIPDTYAKLPGLVYSFQFTNGGGIINYSNDYAVQVAAPEPGLTIPFNGFGSRQSDYRIISFPFDKEFDQLEAEIGPLDKTQWRIFNYESESLTRELEQGEPIQIGKGYWLIIRNSGVTIRTGGGALPQLVTFYDPFGIVLSPGWNQIGNPYTYDIAWNAIIGWENNLSIADDIDDLRVFKGSWSNGSELEAFSGGFVFSDLSTDALLQIPFYRDPAIQGSRVSSSSRNTDPIDAPDWEVNLNLTSGELRYDLGGIGMGAEAKTMFDRNDEMNMPRFLEYLELVHKKERHGYAFSKDVVPTEENHEWEFSVKTNSSDSNIELNWDNSYFGTNSKQLVLWDVKAQRAIDMREQNHYSFNKSRSGDFKIFFGNAEFIEERTRVEQLVLHPVYPNPAVDRFVVSFTLPQQDRVTIEVFDALGRGTSILSASFEAGYHEVPFDCKSNSGMYIIQVSTSYSKSNMRLIVGD